MILKFCHLVDVAEYYELPKLKTNLSPRKINQKEFKLLC